MRKKQPTVGLPEGVPKDNASFGAGAEDVEFSAVDTATPKYSFDTRIQSRPVLAETDTSANSSVRPDMMSRERQNLVLVVAVVTLILAMVAVLRLYNPQEKMPLCDTQPEWNQYNCKAV